MSPGTVLGRSAVDSGCPGTGVTEYLRETQPLSQAARSWSGAIAAIRGDLPEGDPGAQYRQGLLAAGAPLIE
jgi:hypothetical protein